ncbi:serine/threonine-protein kinase ZRK1 isoform X2 [Hevea brasiliensis]|nr:serine/threonine-protein kinase ZRK1 isoform X2 [Hevea brasiliensis]
MMRCFRGNKDEIERETEMALMRNGGMLLEKSIALNNGRGNPIRSFSIQELNNATNNYDPNQRFAMYRTYKMYKGFLQDRPVIVKKYANNENFLERSINEIVFASQMSAHKNVLKLLGCCLESPIPILVFVYAEMGILDHYILKYKQRADLRPLSWKNRLKIAVDVANVIAYLHTAFPRPIVHRDIKSVNILLDEDYRAKLSGFSSSISIPEGKTHIVTEPVMGTLGYLDPEYLSEGKFNEKADVFGFGVLLLELLTGKAPYDPPDNDQDLPVVKFFEKCMEENEKLDKLMDPIIIEEGTWSGKEQQLKAYARLALQCVCIPSENRPEITDVGKQLRQIYQSLISSC